MKKGMKRALTLSLASLMAASALTGCGSKTASGDAAATDTTATTAASTDTAAAGDSTAAGDFTDYSQGFPEQVTLQIPVYERGWEGWNPTDNYWTKYIQENFGDKYNVDVEFVSVGRSTEVQDFTQMLSAGTAPTLIFHYDYPNILAYYAQDAYQELNADEIAYYAPTFWGTMGDTIQEYGKIDDKLMVVMGNRTELVSSNYGTLVRKDWMDALGISMPTNLDEYNDMLAKFKEAGYGYASEPLLAKSFNFDYNFRGWPNDAEGRALNSDLAVASLTWGPTKDYIKNLNTEYNAGLIDPDFYLDTDGNQSKSNFVSGKAATYACYINAGTQDVIDSLKANDPNAELAILDPAAKAPAGEKPQGRKYWPFGMIYGINADATDEQRIAAWMYIEWMSDPEVITTLQNGTEGVNYDVNADGIKVPKADVGEQKLSNNDNGDYWCLVNANKQYATEDEWRKSVIFANSPAGYEYLIEDILKYNTTYDEYYTPDTCFTVPIETLSEYSSDLAELWKESYVQLVTKCPTDADFEAMYESASQEYLDAGYQEILDEKKAAFDAGQLH